MKTLAEELGKNWQVQGDQVTWVGEGPPRGFMLGPHSFRGAPSHPLQPLQRIWGSLQATPCHPSAGSVSVNSLSRQEFEQHEIAGTLPSFTEAN